MTRLISIGGSDAGISAAVWAREVDSLCDVRVTVANDFPNYSLCDLPYYLSGEVADWHTLAHCTAAEIDRLGITLLLHHRAQALDTADKTVAVVDATGQTQGLPYDRLVIATGAVPVRPPPDASGGTRRPIAHSSIAARWYAGGGRAGIQPRVPSPCAVAMHGNGPASRHDERRP